MTACLCFAKMGITPAGRHLPLLLRVPTNVKGLSLLIIRPTDVPTYVEVQRGVISVSPARMC